MPTPHASPPSDKSPNSRVPPRAKHSSAPSTIRLLRSAQQQQRPSATITTRQSLTPCFHSLTTPSPPCVSSPPPLTSAPLSRRRVALHAQRSRISPQYGLARRTLPSPRAPASRSRRKLAHGPPRLPSQRTHLRNPLRSGKRLRGGQAHARAAAVLRHRAATVLLPRPRPLGTHGHHLRPSPRSPSHPHPKNPAHRPTKP